MYAAVAGVTLAGYWVAAIVGLLPAQMMPAQDQASHIAAELVLSLGLMVASWLDLTGSPHGRRAVAAGLGALLYATLNVLGDYADSRAMIATLGLSAALSVGGLVVIMRD